MPPLRAEKQIAEIHAQLARASAFRGYRSVLLALSGALAFAAAFLQPRFVPDSAAPGFVVYWVAVAVVAGLLCASGAALEYARAWRDERLAARRRIETVFRQLVPAYAIGAALTVLIVRIRPESIALAPGLWAVFYGLGMTASAPFLPRLSAVVALLYMACGVVLFGLALSGAVPSPWWVGVPFGVGQIAAGAVQYFCVERNDDDEKE